MRVLSVGGGPAGLYFAILLKQQDPAHQITVVERNAPQDTFGFGVVFSNETLGALAQADPASFDEISRNFARWDDIDIHYRGQVVTSSGHGFSALSRKLLLNILQRRAEALGVELRYRTEVDESWQLHDYDLVLAADGVNSRLRSAHAEAFGPALDPRACKFMWLGTARRFESFKFFFKQTEHGVFQVHAYPYDAKQSTFIVETNQRTWRSAGLDANEHAALPPGTSDDHSIRYLEELFADELGSNTLIANNSKWLNFTTVRNARWSHDNVVLVGDAAHTAHFSIGSGTKLAMEDAIALARAFRHRPGVTQALKDYEAERRPVVESTQRAAQASLEWFEGVERYMDLEPLQFAFSAMTRSRRVTYDNLRVRDEGFVRQIDDWFAARLPADQRGHDRFRPPMFWPLRLRSVVLPNRVVVSAMDMYTAQDGLIGDYHLVHLGSRAQGGAGLVLTEMACTSRDGRITPGCAGIWTDEQRDAWRRIVDFVHRHTTARIGLQIGHAGRKGSTKVMWEGIDQPLEHGNWPLLAPSPIPYRDQSQIPRAMDRRDMDAVRDQFVAAALRGQYAGFDLLELHMAHGYLLSSFISPISNRRSDHYGGPLEHRMRFPLEVLDAVRTVWPEHKPISVKISAHDWVEGGIDAEDSVVIAGLLRTHGCDLVDVSTGQTSTAAKPAYGRSYQTPFADRIRNETGIATMAVGAISSADDVNSIILAGRADLCALGRPHLNDPYWTLHAAHEQGYEGPGAEWQVQYLSGRPKPRPAEAPGTPGSPTRPQPAMPAAGDPAPRDLLMPGT